MKKVKFTLLELLVVVAVIAILLSILLPSLLKARLAALDAVCMSNQKQITFAYNGYAVQNNRFYPAFAKWNDIALNGGSVDNRYVLKNQLANLNGKGSGYDRPTLSVLAPYFGSAANDMEGIRQAYTCPHLENEYVEKFQRPDGSIPFPYKLANANMTAYYTYPNFMLKKNVDVPMRILGEPWQAGTKLADGTTPWSHVLASDIIHSAGNGTFAELRYSGGLPRYKVAHKSPLSKVDDVWRWKGEEDPDFNGLNSKQGDRALGWLQIGTRVRGNYAFDDGSVVIFKGNALTHYTGSYISIPRKFFQEDR